MTLAAILLAADSAGQASIRVKVVNVERHGIERAYASRSTAATWGEDRLKGRSFKSGEAIVLTLEDGCGDYDIRFVAAGGTVEFIDKGVPFCDGRDVITLHKGALKRSRRKAAE